MSQIPAWFERKFTFAYPVELFPNLIVRLIGTPARIEEMTRVVAADTLTRKQGEAWSAQEHAGHLLDMEPLWLARVEDFFGSDDTLTPADLTNRQTDEANHNARDINAIRNDFRAERARLIARVQDLDLNSVSRAVLHPRLQQPMRLIDHLYFVAEHDDHHLARIREMIR